MCFPETHSVLESLKYKKLENRFKSQTYVAFSFKRMCVYAFSVTEIHVVVESRTAPTIDTLQTIIDIHSIDMLHRYTS